MSRAIFISSNSIQRIDCVTQKASNNNNRLGISDYLSLAETNVKTANKALQVDPKTDTRLDFVPSVSHEASMIDASSGETFTLRVLEPQSILYEEGAVIEPILAFEVPGDWLLCVTRDAVAAAAAASDAFEVGYDPKLGVRTFPLIECDIPGKRPIVRIFTSILEPGNHRFAAWMHRPPHKTRSDGINLPSADGGIESSERLLYVEVPYSTSPTTKANLRMPSFYNLSDMLKYKIHKVRSPEGSFVQKYWNVFDPGRGKAVLEAPMPKDAYIDYQALEQISRQAECVAFESPYFHIHLRLGDAFTEFRAFTSLKYFLDVPNATVIAAAAKAVSDGSLIKVIGGIHNKKYVEKSKVYIDTLMAELPADAVSRFRTESGFESVDRDFCSMIHGSGFLKYDLGGGFAQRIVDARCRLGKQSWVVNAQSAVTEANCQWQLE